NLNPVRHLISGGCHIIISWNSLIDVATVRPYNPVSLAISLFRGGSRSMNRITIGSAFLSVTIVAASAGQPAASAAQSAAHNDVLINNAVVMTVTHGNIQNGSIYIKDGKIAA